MGGHDSGAQPLETISHRCNGGDLGFPRQEETHSNWRRDERDEDLETSWNEAQKPCNFTSGRRDNVGEECGNDQGAIETKREEEKKNSKLGVALRVEEVGRSDRGRGKIDSHGTGTHPDSLSS